MATYNGAAYLSEQLQSLARQTKRPAELVVTDDGSTDDTLSLLAAFSRSAPFPVRVIGNDVRLGYRANFMKAAGLCTSDIVAFCDQDDVWLDGKLQYCVERLDASDALLLCHNAIVTDSALAPIDTLAKDALAAPYNAPLTIDPLHHALGFTMLIDRRLTQFSPLWTQSIDLNDGHSNEGHDQWYCFLAGVFGAVLYVDEPLAKYRRHTSAATHTTWAGASIGAQKWDFLFECLPRWENHALAFEHRSAILDAIAANAASRHADAARAGADKYRGVARLYRDRVALYRGATVGTRLRMFADIMARGGYRNADVWAKGTKSALKDLLAGVLHASQMMPATTRTKLRGY
jgi:hypothetical protein